MSIGAVRVAEVGANVPGDPPGGATGARSGASAAAANARPGRALGYLPGLDGLRALAVLGVLFYHADVPWMPGGFLGVDVFFVLSGFLITSLILGELDASNRVDFKSFYLRRARRLLPALLLVLAATAVLGAFLATDAAAALRRDIPASLLYATNWVYVLTDVSYFESIGRPPMLQHLWSLAVEEQFYLVWPLIAWLGYRRGGRPLVRRVAVIGAVLSTLLMAVLSVRGGYPALNDGSRVYFGADTHAMGLMTGAALATFWVPARIRGTIPRGAAIVVNGVGLAALLAVIWVFASVTEVSQALYRGGFLLLSVLVALLIAAITHPASAVGRAMGTQPWRYIGERSYGLYLWHWPIFLVLRPGLDVPIEGWANIALRFAVTFAVAELSYRYVERPIRSGALGRARQRWQSAPTPERSQELARLALAAVVVVLAGTLVNARLSDAAQAEPIPDYLAGATSVSALDQLGGQPDGAQRVSDAPKPRTPRPGRWTPGVTAVGESVMLGARTTIAATFDDTLVDAAVARQGTDFPPLLRQLQAGGALLPTVILHTGSNGYLQERIVREALDILRDKERVVVVNAHVPRRWAGPNNALLAGVVRDYPNARLADWDAVASQKDDLLVDDGVHLTTEGIRAYAALLKATVKEFGPKPPSPPVPSADARAAAATPSPTATPTGSPAAQR